MDNKKLDKKPFNNYIEKKTINNYIEKKPIKNIIEIKENNEIQISKDLSVNNSILADENKTLNSVRQKIQKGISRTFSEIPESFDEIDESTFTKIHEIDQAHQHNYISRETAIDMIAELFERQGFCNSFENYVDSVLMAKLKELFKLLEIKYHDLLHALNTGKIDQREFQERLKKLRELEVNSTRELFSQNETLKKHSK